MVSRESPQGREPVEDGIPPQPMIDTGNDTEIRDMIQLGSERALLQAERIMIPGEGHR